jgi:RHH-type proline utilization regulon transcriptional repressor/proline dehydrogenase/delta 1-pyrroline-5-carboxylate dehydrogenase
MRDQRGTDVALAGQQRKRLARDAARMQRLDDRQCAGRRLLGGLQHHAVASRQAGRDHAGRDREREVPRRDHGDDAVPAIAYSAFGFAGQKCSAASRLLVHERIADTLSERLRGAIDALLVDQAQRFGVDVPPVIEQAAQERVREYAEIARTEGGTVYQPGIGPEHGWFVPPVLVSDLPAGSRVAEEEIFGPLLALQSVASVDEAVEIVSRQPFALTGGLFSRNPATVERVSAALPVGNLYVNRHITGAMVARQPFGGNRLSGTGTKAGGPDYLLNFVEPRVVTEDTMRHGLVV